MDVLKENYRNILDSYFEITEQKFAFSDSELHNAKMVALNAFLGRTKNRIFQKENYIPYLEDSSFEFDENTLKILKMFFVENLTLKGIRERMNITVSPMKLSNIITDSVDRIDKTRFGIVTSHSIDCSKVKEFLQMDSLNDSEKTIFQFKYLSNLKVEDIAKEIGKSSKFVFSVLTRLNKKFLSFQAQDVVISEEEIFSEVSLHPSESVLDKDANTILSLLYGFKNTWNPSGKKLSVNEIAQIYKVRNIKINFQINKYLEDLKLKKIGLLKKDLCYMKREELDILLDDVHVPIREEERDIICKLFGLKGSPYTSLTEIAFEKS